MKKVFSLACVLFATLSLWAQSSNSNNLTFPPLVIGFAPISTAPVVYEGIITNVQSIIQTNSNGVATNIVFIRSGTNGLVTNVVPSTNIYYVAYYDTNLDPVRLSFGQIAPTSNALTLWLGSNTDFIITNLPPLGTTNYFWVQSYYNTLVPAANNTTTNIAVYSGFGAPFILYSMPNFLYIQNGVNNNKMLLWLARTNYAYKLLSSTDFKTWTTLTNIGGVTNWQWENYIDANLTPHKFYRLLQY